MGYLAELEGVLLAGELEVAADEDEHAAGGGGGLAVDGGDGVVALVEGEGGELGDDVLGALDLLALEGEHRPLLVQINQPPPVVVEGRVVVLHERLRQRIWIHSDMILFQFLIDIFLSSLLPCFRLTLTLSLTHSQVTTHTLQQLAIRIDLSLSLSSSFCLTNKYIDTSRFSSVIIFNYIF